jgi:signal transduction histidine kinase
MHAGELHGLEVFGGLSGGQLDSLIAGGTEVRIEPGTELFREGEHADYWWVLLDGAIDLIRHIGKEDTVVGRMDVPGRWAGGFRAWDEHGVYLATGRVAVTGRVLRLPATELRDRINEWFPFGRHLIEGLYRTARSIESTARQREALVTLGTLAAGLAHEINNPAAAAARAVDSLAAEYQTLTAALTQLASGAIAPAQLAALDALCRELGPPGPGGAAQDPMALADREDELSDWLDEHGVDRGWLIAPSLAAAGAGPDWCDRAAQALPGPALQPGLEWAASTFSATALLAEVKESTRRVSELVGAIKSYSQMDRGSVQHIDVTEGLESTLVMLGYRLREGITVVREYGAGLPRVQAHAGELNQVWTNLIDNAVDAMEGRGTLRIVTRAEGDDDGAVVVEICDTGPGMPPKVAARAFEPFFTTKDVGKGTGLGLDIAQRIVVERHGGTIAIDSRPGQTILRVRLPVRGPARK